MKKLLALLLTAALLSACGPEPTSTVNGVPVGTFMRSDYTNGNWQTVTDIAVFYTYTSLRVPVGSPCSIYFDKYLGSGNEILEIKETVVLIK